MTNLKNIRYCDWLPLAKRICAELGRGTDLGEKAIVERLKLLGVDSPEVVGKNLTLHLLVDVLFAYMEANFSYYDRPEIITAISQTLQYKITHPPKHKKTGEHDSPATGEGEENRV